MSILSKSINLKEVILRNIEIDKSEFSENECNDYFKSRVDNLKRKMNSYFSGNYEYKIQKGGHEYVYQLNETGDKFSIHYFQDKNGSYFITEVLPTSKLVENLRK